MTGVRLATPGDEGALRDFLRPHLETSMFLLGNLQSHGLGFGPHSHATRYALLERAGRIAGVLGATRGGYLMCQLPGRTADQTGALVAALGRQPMAGITGSAGQVARVLDALDLPADGWALNRDEPLMRLDLTALADPGAGLVRASVAHRALLRDWFALNVVETGQCGPERAPALAAELADRAIDGRTRLMTDPSGTPVAMATIGARAEGAVQVNGVFVPPGLRRRGHAARIAAALLTEARTAGARVAILFAANDTARRVYLRLGFREIGLYRLAMLTSATMLNPVPA
jgi:GNAT superfamily N-acetyltransferase